MLDNMSEEQIRYNTDCKAGVFAYLENGEKKLLKACPFDTVKFIAGLWRVQNEFKETITVIRDKEFVIYDKLPTQEKNHFEYYTADMVGENCYGKYVSPGVGGIPFIVAKYETKNGTYWSYGNTIGQARAFLGIKLYDEYMDLIHNAIGIDKQK